MRRVIESGRLREISIAGPVCGRPGLRRSRQALELACAASWAEPAITENTHPDVLHSVGTRDDALILDWRHSARGDERT